jgi:hypothetical protein
MYVYTYKSGPFQGLLVYFNSKSQLELMGWPALSLVSDIFLCFFLMRLALFAVCLVLDASLAYS